jgi:hypothetical protein
MAPSSALPQVLHFAQLLLQIISALQAATSAREGEANESLAGDRVPDDAFPAEFAPLAAAAPAIAAALPMILQLLPALLPLLTQLVPMLVSRAPRAAESVAADAEQTPGADGWAEHIETAETAPPGAPTPLAFLPAWSAEPVFAPHAYTASRFEWTH